jgi:outer membrane protein, heavy metal efflux system
MTMIRAACPIALALSLALGANALAAEPTAPLAASTQVAETAEPGDDRAVLVLDDVIRRVLERNPTIAEARAAWSEARARTREVGALQPPMLEAMTAPRSYGSSSVDPAYRLSLEQPLSIFGQRGLERQAAQAAARAAAWDLRTMQLELVRQARLSFVEYWRVGRAIALNRELSQLLPELRRVSLAKYSAGLVGQQDPLRIDAELAMLDHEAVVLERQRRTTVATIQALMHEPPGAYLLPPPDDLPLPDTSVVHGDLAPHARALRSELRAADARVEASRAEASLAERRRWPETTFGIAYDRYWSEPELRTSVSVSMDLPLDLGRRAAARDVARARLAASESRSDAMRDSVELQVELAAVRLHEQAHDVQIARERLVPLRERAFRAARAGYEANRTDFDALLGSLRELLSARLEADESLAMLNEARADLDRALGELPSELAKEELP